MSGTSRSTRRRSPFAASSTRSPKRFVPSSSAPSPRMVPPPSAVPPTRCTAMPSASITEVPVPTETSRYASAGAPPPPALEERLRPGPPGRELVHRHAPDLEAARELGGAASGQPQPRGPCLQKQPGDLVEGGRGLEAEPNPSLRGPHFDLGEGG